MFDGVIREHEREVAEAPAPPPQPMVDAKTPVRDLVVCIQRVVAGGEVIAEPHDIFVQSHPKVTACPAGFEDLRPRVRFLHDAKV
jgi:hypothetical protein